MKRKGLLIAVSYLVSMPAMAINFDFVTTGLNSEALGALNRAGNRWSSQLTDPVTIKIDFKLTNLGSTSIIGNAASVDLLGTYSEMRNFLVNDAANEADDAVVGYLPTANQAFAYVPQNFSLNGLTATKANLKALGVAASSLDSIAGTPFDGYINFNSGFSFDFNAADGVSPGTMDFETVAAHEIGHILGFESVVDDIDTMIHNNQTGTVTPYLLDLFRFGPRANPTITAQFSSMSRDFRPGVASYFDDLSNEVAFSTGYYNGDGNQASHWKDAANNLTGLMEPTLAYSQISAVSRFDLRAMDLIGYEVTSVPLPMSIWLFAGGLLGMAGLGRKRPACSDRG